MFLRRGITVVHEVVGPEVGKKVAVGGDVVVDIVADIGVGAHGEGPLLVRHLRVEAERPVRSGLVEAVLVVVVDLAVLVQVGIETFDRLAVRVIDLLVDEERIRGVAGLMDLDRVAGTAGYAAGSDSEVVGALVIGGKSGDLGLIEGRVEAKGPAPVPCLDRNGVELELDSLVGKVTDVGVQVVGQVGSGGHRGAVQEILGVALVEIHATEDPVAEEAVVKTDVVGRGGLPLEVGVVAKRRDRCDHLVAEVEHRLVRVVLVGRQCRVVTGLEILLARLSPAEPELQG